MNKGVEKGRDLDDAEVLQVVSSLVKQRRDSIEQFSKAGRTDLVDKETGEIAVLERYLPPAASAEEIDAAVAAAIAETRRQLAEGHRQGHEGRDAEARRQERRRPDRSTRPSAASLARLAPHLPPHRRSRARPRRPAPRR